jgi:hypothetical protein
VLKTTLHFFFLIDKNVNIKLFALLVTKYAMIFFWQHWGLNSGSHTCYHLSHSISLFLGVVYFLDRVSLFAQSDLKPQSS